jgi:adenylate cyclase class IV
MTRRGIELEAKFAPAGERTLVELATRTEFPGWRVVGRRDETQHNTYFDTPDGLLEANSCSLRRRILDDGAGGVEWTFKRGRGPGRDGIARRREVNALLPGKKTDLPRARCEPVARALRIAGAQPLQPLFTLLTSRYQIDLARADGARVALALDRLQMEDEPGYRETEIEIELLDGDEIAVADLAIWLMRTYGLLPMRGSKRGRALAWRRGAGLPVVAPALALDLLIERATSLAPRVVGRPVVIALASPRGSGQAATLARALVAQLPAAHLVAERSEEALSPPIGGPLIVEGPEALESGPADIAAWVKVSLPHELLARVIDDATAAGVDAWAILRRCGEYVVPSQRRFIDPAAHWADLVVIDNALPVDSPGLHETPDEQRKLFGWPDDLVLVSAGATMLGITVEHDHFLHAPAPHLADTLRVRLCADTAWVSFLNPDGPPQVVTYEARPRVLTLLYSLGYSDAGSLAKERRRYRLDGWEIALDRVAGLGHFCELRRVAPDDRDAGAIAALLGLSGARATNETYLALWHEAQAPLGPLGDADFASAYPGSDALPNLVGAAAG